MKLQRRKMIANWGMLGVVSVGLAATACKEDSAQSTGEDSALLARLQEAEKDQKAMEDELEELKKSVKEKRDSLRAAKKVHEESLAKVKEELRNAKREKEALEQRFREYREEYKVGIRKKARGIDLGSVKTNSGQSYSDVVVSKWEPAALRVTHSGGNTVLPFSDLPDSIQSIFVYDEEETKELIAAAEEGKEPPVTTLDPSKPAKDNNVPNRTNGGGRKDPVIIGSVPPPPRSGTGEVPGSERKEKRLTTTEKSIAKLTTQIESGEREINKLDRLMNEAIERGRSIESFERKAEKIQDTLKTLRYKRRMLQKQLEA